MNIPAELRYTKEHEWIRVEGDVAYVGITDYAQSELGEIVFVDINTQGETVGQDEVFGSVEAVKTVSDLNMPVTGEVREINETINDQPELVNNDPYGEGWMIKISVADAAELDNLLDAAAYQALIGSTLHINSHNEKRACRHTNTPSFIEQVSTLADRLVHPISQYFPS